MEDPQRFSRVTTGAEHYKKGVSRPNNVPDRTQRGQQRVVQV